MLLSGDRRRLPILDPQQHSMALRCFPVLEKLVTISAKATIPSTENSSTGFVQSYLPGPPRGGGAGGGNLSQAPNLLVPSIPVES